jgi:hypothetical protein
MRRGVLLALAGIVVVTGLATLPVTSGALAPRPAGARPSKIARMVCAPEAVEKIDQIVGQKAVVADKSWVEHLYSCDYRYRSGTMVLSVKELSSGAQTTAYFNSLAKTLGKKMVLGGLGQGAFEVRNGSVVVRKDWKVLVVDTSGLPRQLTAASTTNNVALAVASGIMGCWDGD